MNVATILADSAYKAICHCTCVFWKEIYTIQQMQTSAALSQSVTTVVKLELGIRKWSLACPHVVTNERLEH